MSYLQIEHNFVDLPDKENFKWKNWVAECMWKEERPDGREVVYAFIRKIYNKDDLDIGDTKEDEFFIGRLVKYRSRAVRDTDPKSKTVGQRIRPPIQYDIFQEWNKDKQIYDEIKIPRNVEKTWDYVHEATPEMLKNYRLLVGRLNADKVTAFVFIYGSRPVIVDQDTFFDVKVSDYGAKEAKEGASIFHKEQDKQSKGTAQP